MQNATNKKNYEGEWNIHVLERTLWENSIIWKYYIFVFLFIYSALLYNNTILSESLIFLTKAVLNMIVL